jgi:hypothetical protein
MTTRQFVRTTLQNARFDPRRVVAGMVIMFVVAVGGWSLAWVMGGKIDAVVAPVAQTCRENTSAAAELALSGACLAADQARQAGPYVITKAGDDGADGTNGTDGTNGRDGVNGFTPACYFTPGQCQGRDGTNGTNGTNGVSTDGKDGNDGTNGTDGQSPPCLAEPGQCRGADGRDAPAPASGTYLLPDGRTATCVRAAGTDLDPIYRCQITEPTPDTTEQPPAEETR